MRKTGGAATDVQSVRGSQGAAVKRERDSFLRFLPREHAHFGVRRELGGLIGDRVRMRRDVVGQDQKRRLAGADELARHGEED
jgi:hypothetical protein